MFTFLSAGLVCKWADCNLKMVGLADEISTLSLLLLSIFDV